VNILEDKLLMSYIFTEILISFKSMFNSLSKAVQIEDRAVLMINVTIRYYVVNLLYRLLRYKQYF